MFESVVESLVYSRVNQKYLPLCTSASLRDRKGSLRPEIV